VKPECQVCGSLNISGQQVEGTLFLNECGDCGWAWHSRTDRGPVMEGGEGTFEDHSPKVRYIQLQTDDERYEIRLVVRFTDSNLGANLQKFGIDTLIQRLKEDIYPETE